MVVLYSIRVFFEWYVMVLGYLLGIGKSGKAYYAGKGLIAKPDGSYRLKQGDHNDPLIIFKFYYRLLVHWFRLPAVKPIVEIGNGSALLDSADEPEPRLAFIDAMTGTRPGIFIPKEKMLAYPVAILSKIFLVPVFFGFAILLLPFVLGKRRAMAGLMLHETYECAILLCLIGKYHIKKIIYSCIFDKDSNAVALILQGRGIYVLKNPSEDPLYFNNQVVIADELGLCNAYQREEIVAYKDTMFVKKFSDWMPEMSSALLGPWEGKTILTEKNVIGYYSGSSWLRIHLNYNQTTGAYDPYTAETELERDLATYMKQHPEYTLRIFMHPLEKKHLEISKQYFEKQFGEIRFEYADLQKNTAAQFDACDVAVTVFSGIMIYRFYAGLKGIFYNPYMPGFPISGSSLDRVSAKDGKQLERLLDESMGMGDKEFHEQKLLGKFRPKLVGQS